MPRNTRHLTRWPCTVPVVDLNPTPGLERCVACGKDFVNCIAEPIEIVNHPGAFLCYMGCASCGYQRRVRVTETTSDQYLDWENGCFDRMTALSEKLGQEVLVEDTLPLIEAIKADLVWPIDF